MYGFAPNISQARLRRWLSAGVIAVLLSACGFDDSPRAVSPAVRYDYSLSVPISGSDEIGVIEQRYGGTVISWQPEAGYAVLGLQQDAVQGLGALSTSLEPNKDAIGVPEDRASANAVGLSAWQEGTQAWAGGSQAWAGGKQAWAGGGGASYITLEANDAIWNRIRLGQALSLARKRGVGVKVAVIDSGIDLKHPAFQGRLVSASDMRDWVDGDTVPQEVAGGEGYGHGTVVAGIVAQVAQNARIMPLRVLNPSGKGDTLNVVAAVDWAVQRGARVINLSLGSEDLKSLEQAIANAVKQGVLVVASAGNSGSTTVVFPARKFSSGAMGELAVGVGSTDSSDRKSRFSNYGKNMEMMAPGERIWAPTPENKMAAWSGTSMAAPMVSGALALALGERSYGNLKNLADALTGNSDDITPANPSFKKDELGSGRLNLERFLQTALSLK